MPAERLSMRKIREVLRLRAQGRSDRQVARSANLSRTTVRRIRARADAAGLSWPLPEDLTESALEELLYPPSPPPPLGLVPSPSGRPFTPNSVARASRSNSLAGVQGHPSRRLPVQPVL